MNNGWEVKPVSSIADHCLGKMLDKNKNKGELHDYLRNVNVRWFGFDLTDLKQMRFEANEATKFTARKGDVLICEGGYPGRAAIWNEHELIYFQKAVHRVRFHEPQRNVWFVYYLHFLDLTGEIRQYFTGTGIQHFTGQSLARLPVPLPPLAEQQRIVAILDEAFAGIERAVANTERNLASARELFESKLNRVFAEGGEGWEEKRLGDVAITFGRGKSRHRPRNDPSLYGGRYPFVQTGDIRNAEHMITEYSQTYNEKGLAQSRLWPAGTLCITIAANIAETGILGFDACIPDSVIGLVVDDAQAHNRYVEYLLQFFKKIVQAKGRGSAQANINMGTFKELAFPFPSLAEQNRIVDELQGAADARDQLESLYHEKLTALAELKQSLLARAFAGELTSGAERELAEAGV